MKKIYLDNNASTGVDPQVAEAMLEGLSPIPGNPSSTHYFGREAKQQIAKAREAISSYLHVKPSEIIFTSGGTESLSHLMRGFFALIPRCHIVTSNVEHSCVYNTLQLLEKKGAKVTYLPAGLHGAVKPEQIEEILPQKPSLILLCSVNNETGVKTDIEAIARIAQDADIPFFIDAVSHLGKEPLKIPRGVAAMACSAHKLHGPKGIGLTYLKNLKIEPLLTGGGQEFGMRAGSENLPGILGFAKAVELLSGLPKAIEKMTKLRNRLIEGLMERTGNIVVHGQGPRICNTANIAFPGAEGESLLMQLDLAGIAASHGSACSSGALEPSRILLNMGIPPSVARTSLRFSLSRYTTAEEIETCIDIMEKLLKRKNLG